MVQPTPRRFTQALFSVAAFAWIGGSAVAAPCDVPADARQIPVSEFNAVGDGKTDDGPALRAAIKSAIEGAKPAAIIFERNKVYRLETAEDDYGLNILGGKQIVLRGNGAELSLMPPDRALRIDGSADIAVCDFTVDYSPLPFTQGTIVAADRRAGTFEVAIEDGYSVPAVDEPGVEVDRRKWRFAMPFGSGDKHMPRVEISAVYAGSAPRQVKVKPLHASDVERLTVNETRLVMVNPGPRPAGGFVFRITGSERVHFDSIRIYAVPLHTLLILNNLGPVSFNKVELRRRPGTTRMMTAWRDMFHGMNNRGPVTIENCYAESNFDDAINLSAMFQQVVEKLDGDRWKLRDLSVTDRAPPIKVGDRLQAIDIVPQRRLLGETRVTAVSQDGSGETVLSLSPALPLTPRSTCKAETRPQSKRGGSVCGTRVVNLDAANENSVIRGCTIHGTARLRSKTTFENNVIEAGRLIISADPIRVGPLPNGTTVRNNDISGVLRIGADNTQRDIYNTRWDTGERWARNIVLENNRIQSVFRADGAQFSLNGDNLIGSRPRKLIVRNSGPVRVRNLKSDGEPIHAPLTRFRLDDGTSERDIIVEDPAPN